MAEEVTVDLGGGNFKPVQMEFPGNSNKDRSGKSEPKPKKVERVVTSEVVRKKKPLGRKVAETFVVEDAHSVASFIALDVLIPAAKKTLLDAICKSAERTLYGSSRPQSPVGKQSAFTSYQKYYSGDGSQKRDLSYRARATHDFDEVILHSRSEAEDILDQMATLIEEYGVVSLRDLYTMLGVTAQYTDEKFGWKDLRGCDVHPVREGYLLNLSKPVLLD